MSDKVISDILDNPWIYTPLSVRLIPSRKTLQAQALSGIYVFNPAHLSPGFCLTISHLSENIGSEYDIQVATPHFSKQSVSWLDGILQAKIPVFDQSDPLFDHISTCIRNGFNFFPCDSLPKRFSINSLCILIITCDFSYDEKYHQFFRDFQIQRATLASQITVRSCPFSFTNCPIFADFTSTGHVSMVIESGEITWGYLSDMKYLENMVGAVVLNASLKSAGVVLGNLRKINGDGDLLVVLPLERIFSRILSSQTIFGLVTDSSRSTRLVTNDIRKKLKSCIETSFKTQKANKAIHNREFQILPHFPVFPIVISDQGTIISWGSCVLLNHNCLITNTHVIHPFSSGYQIECEIVLGNNMSIFLSDLDNIINPFEQLDLSFIHLSPEKKKALSGFSPIDSSFRGKASPGDQVISVGYGLSLTSPPVPLLAKGYISSSLSLQPFKCDDMGLHTPNEINCMLVTSSSCWNGSSGGGLFTLDGKFMGIICCNAEVRVPSTFTASSSDSEIIPSFGFCIPSELVMECYRLTVLEPTDNLTISDDLVRAWSLGNDHSDSNDRQSKL